MQRALDFLDPMAEFARSALRAHSRLAAEILPAAVARQIQPRLFRALPRLLALAMQDSRVQMAICACHVAQADIRMQRAIHLAWLVVKDRFRLFHLQLPALDVLQELLQLTGAHCLQQTVSCVHLGRIHPLRRQFVER